MEPEIVRDIGGAMYLIIPSVIDLYDPPIDI